MITTSFSQKNFEHNHIQFQIVSRPVSFQNKNDVKKKFISDVHKITSQSKYIVTSTCWIAIDYYCQHMKRMKNPGAYDIDNIVKPILDSLTGLNGVLIDDVIVDRVTVNWVDTPNNDYLDIELQYPELLYHKKADLIFVESKNGWCFPAAQSMIKNATFIELLKRYFETWNSINTEDDYYKLIGILGSV